MTWSEDKTLKRNSKRRYGLRVRPYKKPKRIRQECPRLLSIGGSFELPLSFTAYSLFIYERNIVIAYNSFKKSMR